MAEPTIIQSPLAGPDRRAAQRAGRSFLSGIECRIEDAESTKGLHSVAILFRVMSGLLMALMLVQVALGLTSTVDISLGVLIGEAVRLVIFAGLLWAAGDLADLFIKSHCDLRATKIMIARLTTLAEHLPARGNEHPGAGGPSRGRTDAGQPR